VRHAFYVFTAFIIVSFLAMGAVFNHLAHGYMDREVESKVNRDLEMVATITQGALAYSDYERIEEQILLWWEKDPDIIVFRVTLEGDQPLVEFDRQTQSEDVLCLTRTVVAPSGREVAFEMTYDLSSHHRSARNYTVAFFVFGGCIGAVFMVSLWMILRRLAIVPLQKEIASRQRAEAAVRQSRDFLQRIIDGVGDSVMVIDREYGIVLANRAAREMIGGKDPVAAHMKCHQVSHARDLPCEGEEHVCPLKHVLSTGKPMQIEHTHRDSAGREIFVDILAAPVFNEAGDVVQVIEAVRDVTTIKRGEEDRRELEAQIQHTQKLESLGVLAGGIAHDFNNLLMAILGNADLALMDLSPVSPVRNSLSEIKKASLRAAELAKQMLAYSGKGRFVVEPLDLSELVEEMTHMLQASISKKAVLKFHFADALPAIQADATQIRQVVMNLITNASEAICDRGGFISITTGVMQVDRQYLRETYLDENLPTGTYVMLEVADSGCGMDAETQARIFDPFFTTKFTGRGLGMAAVMGIVRGHGGAIKIYSEVGKGTTMKVLIPAISDAAAPTHGPREAGDQWRGKGTVLLVDDEETVRTIGTTMLSRLGMTVITAVDGRDAVEVFARRGGEIDCVILDLTMPRADGEQAFREMCRIDPNVRVIMSSGYNEQEVTQRFVGKGIVGFIQKPYELQKLAAALREAIEK